MLSASCFFKRFPIAMQKIMKKTEILRNHIFFIPTGSQRTVFSSK